MSHHRSSQFKVKCLTRKEVEMLLKSPEIRFEFRYREVVGVLVVNAQATANINMLNDNIFRSKSIFNFGNTHTQIVVSRHIGNLRADVKMYANHTDIFQVGQHVDNLINIFHIDTEFILVQSGGDVVVRVSIHIWIDAQCYRCCFIFCSSQFVDHFQLGHRFYIETENVIFKCQIYFPVGFTHSCKNYFGRWNTGINSSLNFSATHAVGAQPGFFDNFKNFGINIGFEGVMHFKVMTCGKLVYFFQCIAKHI